MATFTPDQSLQQKAYVVSIPNNKRSDAGVAGSGNRFRRDP